MGQDKTKKVEFAIGEHFYRATSENLNSSRLLEAAATAAEDRNPRAHTRELMQPDGNEATMTLSQKFGNSRDGVYRFETSNGVQQGSFRLEQVTPPTP